MNANRQANKRGQVKIGKKAHRFDPKEVSKVVPKIPGFKNIDVCSSSRRFRGLSPMLLGPIEHKEEEGKCPKTATNLENLWQGSKVYAADLDDKGNITERFFKRRAEMFAAPEGRRHAVPKEERTTYQFHYWQGERLSSVQARAKIYCPIYAEHVPRTPEYMELDTYLNIGYNLKLGGFDGYDMDLTKPDDVYACFQDTSKPFGHEQVLGCLLGDVKPLPWVRFCSA